MWDFLKNLIGRLPLVFLAIGAIFIAAAATGGLPSQHVVVTDPVWRIVLAAFGTVLIAISALFAMGELKTRGRETLDAKPYEISITSAQQDPAPKSSVTVSGFCKELPKGYELWVFAISGAGRGAKYWPQDLARPTQNIWSVQCHIGKWKTGDQRKYGTFVVGENGQALIHCFKSVAYELSPNGNPPWPGMTVLTSDILQCGPVRDVTLT